MGLIDRLKLKKILKIQGKNSFYNSMLHAIDGINYALSHERNLIIEIIIAIIVSISGIIFKVSIIEWLALVLTIAIIISLEMINTAIERTVDLATKEYKELARIAKDVSAGAVLIMSLFSIIIGIIIFLPKIINIIF